MGDDGFAGAKNMRPARGPLSIGPFALPADIREPPRVRGGPIHPWQNFGLLAHRVNFGVRYNRAHGRVVHKPILAERDGVIPVARFLAS